MEELVNESEQQDEEEIETSLIEENNVIDVLDTFQNMYTSLRLKQIVSSILAEFRTLN